MEQRKVILLRYGVHISALLMRQNYQIMALFTFKYFTLSDTYSKYYCKHIAFKSIKLQSSSLCFIITHIFILESKIKTVQWKQCLHVTFHLRWTVAVVFIHISIALTFISSMNSSHACETIIFQCGWKTEIVIPLSHPRHYKRTRIM